jgi:hypothetical protein
MDEESKNFKILFRQNGGHEFLDINVIKHVIKFFELEENEKGDIFYLVMLVIEKLLRRCAGRKYIQFWLEKMNENYEKFKIHCNMDLAVSAFATIKVFKYLRIRSKFVRSVFFDTHFKNHEKFVV